MNRPVIALGAVLATSNVMAALFSVPVQATPVPAVSEYSLAAMAVVLVLAAWRILRRR